MDPQALAPSRRRLFALGGLWLAISAAVLLAPGCYGRNCEPSIETFGIDPGQGRMVNDTTWESSPQDSRWVPFPRQRYYVFDIRALGGRTPQIVLPYVSAQEEPMKGGGNYTLGGGNLTLLANALPNRIDVKNDTCSDYFLRLVVIVPPLPPEATPDRQDDASAPDGAGDAGATDAADAGDGGT